MLPNTNSSLYVKANHMCHRIDCVFYPLQLGNFFSWALHALISISRIVAWDMQMAFTTPASHINNATRGLGPPWFWIILSFSKNTPNQSWHFRPFFLISGSFLLKSSSSISLEERSVCKTDNLLNALVNHIPDSYQFWSAYFSIPATSVTTVCTVRSNVLQVRAILISWHSQLVCCQLTLKSRQLCNLSISTIFNHSHLGSHLRLFHTTQFLQINHHPGWSTELCCSWRWSWEAWWFLWRESRDRTCRCRGAAQRATPTLPNYLAATYPPFRISSGCSCLSVPAAATSNVYLMLHMLLSQISSFLPRWTVVLLAPAFSSSTSNILHLCLHTDTSYALLNSHSHSVRCSWNLDCRLF